MEARRTGDQGLRVGRWGREGPRRVEIVLGTGLRPGAGDRVGAPPRPRFPADFRIGSRDTVPARGGGEAGCGAKVPSAVRLVGFALAGGAGARSAEPGGEGPGTRGEAAPRTAVAPAPGTLRRRRWGAAPYAPDRGGGGRGW